MLGQATLGHGHPDELALRLLQCHLGVGMSSLLFQRLREDHGVAYDWPRTSLPWQDRRPLC